MFDMNLYFSSNKLRSKFTQSSNILAEIIDTAINKDSLVKNFIPNELTINLESYIRNNQAGNSLREVSEKLSKLLQRDPIIPKRGARIKHITLNNTESSIVLGNGKSIYAFIIRNGKGFFCKASKKGEPRKEVLQSSVFGNIVCHLSKQLFNSNGFFTSDEVPGRYGISSKDLKTIKSKFRNFHESEDLIVILAYPINTSKKIKKFIYDIFRLLFYKDAAK